MPPEVTTCGTLQLYILVISFVTTKLETLNSRLESEYAALNCYLLVTTTRCNFVSCKHYILVLTDLELL